MRAEGKKSQTSSHLSISLNHSFVKRKRINQVYSHNSTTRLRCHFMHSFIDTKSGIGALLSSHFFSCILLPRSISITKLSTNFDCACHQFDESFIMHRHDHFVFRLTHHKKKKSSASRELFTKTVMNNWRLSQITMNNWMKAQRLALATYRMIKRIVYNVL